jgi:hypothetical protein
MTGSAETEPLEFILRQAGEVTRGRHAYGKNDEDGDLPSQLA